MNSVVLVYLRLLSKFSWFSNLIKVIARCIRNCRKISSQQLGFLISDELDRAHTVLIKFVQQQSFAAELQVFKTNQVLPSKSKLKCLNPLLDTDNIIRVILNTEREINHKIINAFKRFMSKCGKPPFRQCSEQELSNTIKSIKTKWYQHNFHNSLTDNQITWHYSTKIISLWKLMGVRNQIK